MVSSKEMRELEEERKAKERILALLKRKSSLTAEEISKETGVSLELTRECLGILYANELVGWHPK